MGNIFDDLIDDEKLIISIKEMVKSMIFKKNIKWTEFEKWLTVRITNKLTLTILLFRIKKIYNKYG